MTNEEQKQLEKKALDQFMLGKSLFGKDGAFTPMLKNFIEKALDAEMDDHLDESEGFNGNKRTGKGKKRIKSGFGTFEIDTHQDSQSSSVLQLYIKFGDRVPLILNTNSFGGSPKGIEKPDRV